MPEVQELIPLSHICIIHIPCVHATVPHSITVSFSLVRKIKLTNY